jgi:WD40 repeat protein
MALKEGAAIPNQELPMTLDPKRVESVFTAALAVTDPAARADCLRRECGDDELRQRVEALLAAHAEAGSFLDAPAAAATTDDFPTGPERPGTESPPEAPAIPGYEIEALLGRGGMGVVYRARHLALKRSVALKMILGGGHAGPAELARFRLEAEAVARLQHPNIVQIHEVGTAGGHPYCALEFVEGGSLAGKLKGKPLPAREAARLVETLARAMQLAHSRNVVHRDLKPANVLLTEEGIPKISDFGLARQLDSDSGETQAGAVIGTPSYMAPEQASGRAHEAGPAADVYALGAILYDCLAGRPPFVGKTVVETLDMVRNQEPVPPSRWQQGVPPDLETVCLKCLRKEPEQRYSSAAELADELGRFLRGEPITARPVSGWERLAKWARRNPVVSGLAGAVVVVAAVGFALVWWKWHEAAANEQRALTIAGQLAIEKTNVTQQRDAANSANEKLNIANANLSSEQAAVLEANRVLQTQLAQRDWEAGNPARLRELLSQQLPRPGEKDLRGFEWFYFNSQFHAGLTLRGHTREVMSVCFSPDGSLLATASADGTIKVWDAGTGREKQTLVSDQSFWACAVCFSPDGTRLAGGGAGRLVVWDLSMSTEGRQAGGTKGRQAGGREMLALERNPARIVYRLAYSPDGALLAGAGNGSVRVWDTRTGKETLVLEGQRGAAGGLAFSPDGTLLATTPTSRPEASAVVAAVFDVRSGKKVTDLTAPGSCAALAFSPPGGKGRPLLAAALADKNGSLVAVWDLDNVREPLLRFRDQAFTITSVAFSPDGEYLAAGFNPDAFLFTPGFVKAWKLRDGPNGPGLPVMYRGPRGWVENIAFGPAGQGQGSPRLAGAFHDGTVRVWDVDSGSGSITLPDASESVLDTGLGPDGARLVSLARDKTVTVWKVEGGPPVLLRTLAGHPDKVVWSTFSPDGLRLACASEKGTVTVWDLATGNPACTLEKMDSWPQARAFSPDGTILACITAAAPGRAAAVQLWDVSMSTEGRQAGSTEGRQAGGTKDRHAGGKLLRTLDQSLPINSVAFSPDGGRVTGALALGATVQVWDVRTGQLLQSLTATGLGLGGQWNCLAYSPDGARIACGTTLGETAVWDAGTGRQLLALKGKGRLYGVCFSPDGRRLATSGMDGMLTLWNANNGHEVISLRVPPGVCRVAGFSPDGTSLAAAAGDGTLRLWSAGRGEPGRAEFALPVLDRRLAAAPRDGGARRRRAALLAVGGAWDRAPPSPTRAGGSPSRRRKPSRSSTWGRTSTATWSWDCSPASAPCRGCMPAVPERRRCCSGRESIPECGSTAS